MTFPAEQADQLFRSALVHLGAGEPIPLHWAIEHGDRVPGAWVSSRDPELLLGIAAYAVARQELVLAACAVARTVLPDFVDDARALTAIETAEAWADARATAHAVKTAADAAGSAAEYTSCTHWGWIAARDAARTAIAHTAGIVAHLATGSVLCAVSSRACRAVAALVGDFDIDAEVAMARVSIGDVVHKQFADRGIKLTLEDLVQASQRGRAR